MSSNYADNLGKFSSFILPDVRAEITLGKDVLPYFDRLEIKQYHDKFHEFTLVIDHDVLEQPRAYNPEQSRELVGEILNVTLKHTNGSGKENYFKGIVTALSLKQGEGYHGKLVLEARSPDFLLDGQPHVRCFYQENLADIVDTLSASLKAVQSKIEVKPARSGGVEYACQFRESNLAFLRRLAADLGEWFFFDGKKFFFGKPKDEEDIPLVYGRDSDRMSLKMRVKPLSFGRYAYAAASDGFTAFKAPLALKGIGDFGSLTLGKAKKLFKEEGLMPVPFPQVGEGAAQSRLERQSADLSLLEGESRNHLLHPGAVVDLKFSVKAEQLFEHKPSGRYRILEAVHHLDAKGRYKNSFRAIPADSPMLPQQHAERPKTEPQLAVVTDNNDPEGLGRVRVKFLWQDGDVFTPFLRILRPDFGAAEQGGANRGYFWIPEIGDQVLVQFFEGMPEQPYVAGALGHGKNKASGHLVKNHLKSISTRTGHTIEFNDAEGGTSITIKDHAGNEIFLDTQGRNITITAPETMTFNAENMVLNVGKTMSVNVGEQMQMHIVEKLLVNTAFMQQITEGLMHLQSGQALINSENNIKIEAEEVYAAGMKKMFVHSDETLVVNSKGTAEMKGEAGNKLLNQADVHETVKPAADAKCLVHFRPGSTYAGEYGFDWMRTGDTGAPGDEKYEDIVGKSYDAKDGKTPKDPRYEGGVFQKSEKEYEKLKKQYKQFTVPWKKDENDKATPYFIPVLTLLKDETAVLTLLTEIEEEPKTLKFKYNTNYLSLSKEEVNNTAKTEGKLRTEVDYLSVTCCEEFDKDQHIEVIAVDEDGDERTAGKLTLKANAKKHRRVADIVFVPVKIVIDGKEKIGSVAGEEEKLKKFLKQALVTANIQTVKEFNLIPDKVFNTTYIKKVKANKDKVIYAGKGVKSLHLYLAEEFDKKEEYKAYKNYKKVFFFDENGYTYVNDQNPEVLSGGSEHYGHVVMYKRRNTLAVPHELLHAYGLPHSFSNEGTFTFELQKTDNIMDYSHVATKPIERISSWQWQWEAVRAKLKEEK